MYPGQACSQLIHHDPFVAPNTSRVYVTETQHFESAADVNDFPTNTTSTTTIVNTNSHKSNNNSLLIYEPAHTGSTAVRTRHKLLVFGSFRS